MVFAQKSQNTIYAENKHTLITVKNDLKSIKIMVYSPCFFVKKGQNLNYAKYYHI